MCLALFLPTGQDLSTQDTIGKGIVRSDLWRREDIGYYEQESDDHLGDWTTIQRTSLRGARRPHKGVLYYGLVSVPVHQRDDHTVTART